MKNALIVLGLLTMLLSTGCVGTPAALDLIAVARTGIANAQEAQANMSGEIVSALEAKNGALDRAFDNDVRLCAAGKIVVGGKAVAFTPEWVISARKGYSVAKGFLATQIADAKKANDTNLDNLKASDEALEMASELLILQSSLSRRMKASMFRLLRKD